MEPSGGPSIVAMSPGTKVTLLDSSGVAIGTPESARPINPMALVRDAGGVPQAPREILERLRQWEPALGLRYINVQWAFTWTWKADDKRRERIRNGEYPEDAAWDIIGWIPLDCPVDSIPAYACRALVDYPIEEIRKLADSVGRYNTVDVAKQHVDQVLDATFGGGGDVQVDNSLGADIGGNDGQVSVDANLTTSNEAPPQDAPAAQQLDAPGAPAPVEKKGKKKPGAADV